MAGKTRRKRVAKPTGPKMPPELARFRFKDWTRDGDADGFSAHEAIDKVREGTEEERRWVWLMAKALRRHSEAKWRWRSEHEGVPLPAALRRLPG